MNKSFDEIRAELDAINSQLQKKWHVSDKHLLLVADPNWQKNQEEGQKKRKSKGWNTKMIGNQNGKNSSRMTGKKHSEKSKQLLREKMTGRDHSSITGVPKQTYVCPHCNKQGRGPAMFQWHFDMCRSKSQ